MQRRQGRPRHRRIHRLSDVIVVAILGLLSLWVTYAVVRRGPAMAESRRARRELHLIEPAA